MSTLERGSLRAVCFGLALAGALATSATLPPGSRSPGRGLRVDAGCAVAAATPGPAASSADTSFVATEGSSSSPADAAATQSEAETATAAAGLPRSASAHGGRAPLFVAAGVCLSLALGFGAAFHRHLQVASASQSLRQAAPPDRRF
jgi:hypothetical protein